MTFVKGASTWANIASDLTKLACGEMADGSGVTVATADRWVREYDTTVDAIRSHASKDVSLPQCSMRIGYWAAISGGANGAGLSTFMQQTACFAAKPAWVGANGRWCYRLYVYLPNTTAGDYSTASIRVYAWDMDSGSYQYSGQTVVPAANGNVSYDGMTFKVGDPSGILTQNAEFMRMFTSTFLGGIDFWPMWSRRSGTATFGTAPPGTQATDWDLAEVAPPWGYCSSASYSSSSNMNWTPCWGSGLGVKTNVALTGAVYTVAFPIALHKLRIAQSATAGTLRLDYGRLALDGATYRRTSGFGTAGWLYAFQTPAQVTNAAVINYWMVVKPDCIIVVLSGDPGLTGKVGCAHVSTFTPYDTTYDNSLPVVWNQGTNDYTFNQNDYAPMDVNKTQFNYWAMRRRQDGTEGTRDWQTKWMRADFFELGASWAGMWASDDSQAPIMYMWGQHFAPNAGSSGHPTIVPVRQLKPHPIDNKWWLYGLPVSDADPFTSYQTPANPGTMDLRFIRGVLNSRWWYLPGDGWANLDELTDNSTTQKYLLVAADYQGVGGRMYVGGGYTGGVAIAEV